MSFKKTIKDWMLPIAMMTGASVYLIYRFSPSLHFAGPFLGNLAGIMQPLLIFAMLFLTFCRILNLTDGIGGCCSFKVEHSQFSVWQHAGL